MCPRPTELLPEAVAKLPWPKSMRWGRGHIPLGEAAAWDCRDVRRGGDPFEMAGVKSSNITRGHRFLSSGEITVRRFEDYEKKLRDAHVILDGAERRDMHPA